MNGKPMIDKVVVVRKVAAASPVPHDSSFDPKAHPPEYEMHVFVKGYDDRASDATLDRLLDSVGIESEDLAKFKLAIRALSFGDYVSIDVPYGA